MTANIILPVIGILILIFIMDRIMRVIPPPLFIIIILAILCVIALILNATPAAF